MKSLRVKKQLKKQLSQLTVWLAFIGVPYYMMAQTAGIERDLLFVQSRSSEGNIRTPAEFEKQDAVWLAWPAYDYELDLPMVDVTAEIIRVLKPHIPIKLLVWDEEMQAVADSTLEAKNIPTDHVTFIPMVYDEPWLRDMGPVFVIADGEQKEMVDFNFNAWGNYAATDEYPRIEEPVDRLIAEYMGIPNNMTRLIGEGGNREFNGKGVMMCVAPTELQRNPNMTLEEIEEEFKRLFGITKVIWLPHHLYDDSKATTVYPGPNGEKAYGYGVAHVDEMARFVGRNKIMLAEVPAFEAEMDTFALVNRQRMEENYEVLKQATDQDGNPFEIVRFPAAMTEYMQLTEEDYSHFISSDLTMDDGNRGHEGPIWWVPAKSYGNFLITNGAVLVTQYWRPGRPMLEKEKDEEAVTILQAVFPDREIITFPPELALAVNAGGGGIHCITANEPSLNVVSNIENEMENAGYSLSSNYPNPFREYTTVNIQLAETSKVNLQIFDINGQLVRTLMKDQLPAGDFQATWDGKDKNGIEVPTGVLFYHLQIETASGKSWEQTKRMLKY